MTFDQAAARFAEMATAGTIPDARTGQTRRLSSASVNATVRSVRQALRYASHRADVDNLPIALYLPVLEDAARKHAEMTRQRYPERSAHHCRVFVRAVTIQPTP